MIKNTKILKKLQKAVDYQLSNNSDEAIKIYESLMEKNSYDLEILKPLAGLYMEK